MSDDTPATAEPAPRWIAMGEAHLAAVIRIAAAVHPGYPEDPQVFAERQRLYGQGCRVLSDELGADELGALHGYLIGHPWHDHAPPPLNSLLGAIPAAAGTYYLHDLALMPSARRNGHALAAVAQAIDQARRAGFTTMSLVAVNGSARYWERHGFAGVNDPALASKLASYGGDAVFMVRRER
jgi:GNAT superfamily N-acetyltransferase